MSAAPAAPPAERDLTPLVAELRRAVGDKWVYTQQHQLRTYESDGLLQFRRDAHFFPTTIQSSTEVDCK